MMTMQTELMPTSPVNGEKTLSFFLIREHTFQSSIRFEPYKPYEKALTPTEGIQTQAKKPQPNKFIYRGRHFVTV